MKLIATLLLVTLPMCAQEYKIAIIGMVHSHVWGHLKPMLDGKEAKLVGIAETNPELIAEAKKRGAKDGPANYTAKAQADSGALGHVWRLHGIVGHGGPGSSGVGKYFFDWLTDPEKNGVALDINVGVNEIIEAAKMSVKNGQAVKLPLKH